MRFSLRWEQTGSWLDGELPSTRTISEAETAEVEAATEDDQVDEPNGQVGIAASRIGTTAMVAAAIRAAGSWANSAVSTDSTCSISIFLREFRMISGHRKLFQAPRKANMVMVPMCRWPA